MSESKSCRECAEDVGADDAKCRHCGANLHLDLLEAGGSQGCTIAWAVLLLIGLLGFGAAVVIPNLIPARGCGNETGAIGGLKTIGAVQSLFREADKEGDGNLDYGSLAELGNPGGRGVGLVDSLLASGTKQGYYFQATYGAMTSEFIWFGTARPQLPGTSGDRYFCTNHEGEVFYTVSGPFRLNNVDCTIPAGARAVGR